MASSLADMDAQLDELIDGVAYDHRDGASPESTVAMTVALYGRDGRRAAQLLGAALVRLASLWDGDDR